MRYGFFKILNLIYCQLLTNYFLLLISYCHILKFIYTFTKLPTQCQSFLHIFTSNYRLLILIPCSLLLFNSFETEKKG